MRMRFVSWPLSGNRLFWQPKRYALVISMGFLSFARAKTDTAAAASVVSSDHLDEIESQGQWRHAAVQRYITELSTDDTSQTFNTTFAFPSQGGIRNAPLLLLLNGASCESWEYSDFLDDLTSAGFVTIVTDLWKKVGPEFPARGESCPKDRIVIVSSNIVEPILSFIAAIKRDAGNPDESALADALAQADTASLVLIGHSLGGMVAADLLQGDFNGSQQPSLVDIKGAVIFEGGSKKAISVRKPKFCALLTSTIGEARNRQFFDKTEGTKDFVVLHDCNHFGINNFHKENKYMVAPCAVPMDNKTAHFQTTERRQKEVISTVAQITVLEIKARAMQEEAAAAALQDVQKKYSLIDKAIISR